MEAELSYLSKLLLGLKVEKDQIIRIVYAGVLNKYEDLSRPPTITVDYARYLQGSKVMKKFTEVSNTGCILVLLFRKASPVTLGWDVKTCKLSRFDDPLPTLEEWIDLNIRIRVCATFDLDLEIAKKDPILFSKESLFSIRSLVGRLNAIEKTTKVSLILSKCGIEEANEVLRFLYLCEKQCGRNPRVFQWYNIETRATAEIENDSERDLFVLLFISCYDKVKIEAISKLLISCATDLWDEFGYHYPQFFTECGVPTQSRYKLFLSYVELEKKKIL